MASQGNNPDPAYLRGLIARAGIGQREAARGTASALSAPYPVQYALERLASGDA